VLLFYIDGRKAPNVCSRKKYFFASRWAGVMQGS
jgi:hypothetical protein